MNKKQLIIAWVIGIIFLLFSLFMGAVSLDEISSDMFKGWLFALLFVSVIPISVIGGLSIYTLRDKKK